MCCFVILLLSNEMQMSVRRFLQSRTLELPIWIKEAKDLEECRSIWDWIN